MLNNLRNFRSFSPWLGLVLLLSAGCASRQSAPKNYMMFPPPPDEARIQFLWSYGSETELGKRSSFEQMVVGKDSLYRPIIKPYGATIKDGKVYVCDTQAANISIADLKARRMRYIKPVGQAAIKVPVNVAVDGAGRVYVTDTGRAQILVFDAQGQLLKAVGKKDEMKPCGLWVTEKEVWITDLKNSQVKVFDKETFELVRAFGGKTDADEKKRLFQPTNLLIDPLGRVVVSDTGGFAVKIFDQQGNHLQTIGELGVSPGQFALPKGVGADREGRIYVLDSAAPVIQLFDKGGRLLMYFGEPSSSGPGGLYLPAGLTVDYANTGLFEKYVAPGYQIEYLILVTNQAGPRKVCVYGFLKKA